MSKLNSHNACVLYPKVERATAFLPHGGIPFSNAVIGTTLPCATYQMKRGAQNLVNVFEYVTEGEGEIFCNGEWTKVSEGDCYVLLAKEAHEYRSNPKNPMKKIWINYIADYVSSMLASYGIRSGVYHAPDAFLHFDRLIQISESGEYSDDVSFEISDCVHGIIRCIARSVFVLPEDDEYGIKRALAARVYSKLNLDELAAELHISKSQIIRSFKKREGTTPYEYFLTLKIRTAKILLRDTKMQIREIAEKLSMCDEHYFSAMFSLRVGMTPREYRNKKTLI
jgi:AraC-like DNA-binding protein